MSFYSVSKLINLHMNLKITLNFTIIICIRDYTLLDYVNHLIKTIGLLKPIFNYYRAL